jgi:hypothetical protein
LLVAQGTATGVVTDGVRRYELTGTGAT